MTYNIKKYITLHWDFWVKKISCKDKDKVDLSRIRIKYLCKEIICSFQKGDHTQTTKILF